MWGDVELCVPSWRWAHRRRPSPRLAPLLAMKVHREIAGIIRRGRILAIFALKALRARPGLQQRAIYREVFIRGQAPRSRLFDHLPQELLATSASSSRSRFLVNTVGFHTSSSRFNPTNQRN